MIDAGEQTGHAGGSAVPESPAPNIVHVGDQTITLHPAVTLPLGMAALSVIKQGGGQAVMEAGLAEVYLRFGIESWTFRDAAGLAEPVTPEAIARLLPYGAGGLEVAEACDALYSEEILRPLAERLSRRSPTTRTGGSTSVTPRSGSMRRMRSGQSSLNGTAGSSSEGPVG